MNTSISIKPQAAKDAGLFTREEAAVYLGMSKQAFNMVSRQIPSVRLGAHKYYAKDNLLAYVAGRVQTAPVANIPSEAESVN